MAFKRALLYLGGTLRIRVRGASIERFLNLCARHDIRLRQIERVDFGVLCATVSIRDFRRLRGCMGRSGCRIRVLQRQGGPFLLRQLQGRYVLFAGLGALMCLSIVLTQFLWGIRLIVPESISTAEVLQHLQALGVHTGKRMDAIDLDAVQTGLLQEMPTLSFVSVTLQGNRLDVQVYVRTPKPTMIDQALPTSVVATQTGIITKINVYQGTAVKKVGDLVQQGETLASALVLPTVEQGQARLVHARADVEARTWYEVTAKRVLTGTEKQFTDKERSQYALVFGKKRVNFYFGCGISDTECDKIIQEYQITFADHFTVPIRLVRQTYRYYEQVPAQAQEDLVRQEMEQNALARLESSIQGTITAYSSVFRILDGGAELTLYAECKEQIGQEILDQQQLPAPMEGEQENDGTDLANRTD